MFFLDGCNTINVDLATIIKTDECIEQKLIKIAKALLRSGIKRDEVRKVVQEIERALKWNIESIERHKKEIERFNRISEQRNKPFKKAFGCASYNESDLVPSNIESARKEVNGNGIWRTYMYQFFDFVFA